MSILKTDPAGPLGEAGARLRALVAAIYTTVRGDEKSECWTIRRWLDERGIYNDDIQGDKRLIEIACKDALLSVPVSPPRKNADAELELTNARLAVNDWHACATQEELERWRQAQQRLIAAAKNVVTQEGE